ncbi:hypothetical protein [Kineosporia sp. NBRC 101731]|uniref:hypothetical protein n=1 Tax=Kineosporia sp. NBRC 101731 TaxID=3032199 RepID=UPI0024A42963|nr:hypothetical protein [Kineosporia sp. NBRC 101731]GLY29229.1 hypothetical protein Kisp02_25940 [Kineosporia sp. NBRC 101731]
MADPVDAFLDLSVSLTGFSHFQLLGTGMAEVYRSTLEQVLPADVLLRVLRAAAENQPPPQILADPDLGPVARNLVLLWYCGTWTPLPDDWRERHGTCAFDTHRVISAEAYRSGLQWVAAGAHPAGAYQQGFGAWALPPDVLAPGASPLLRRSVA